jgi:precorrin-6Y C5,15-methyltransferase (decarboxylating)
VSQPVHIIGIGADGLDGLSPRTHRAIAEATFLAGGLRHLALIGSAGAETLAITNNVAELIERLQARQQNERCVVLASGDPMFFGIGHALSEALGHDQILVDPALSSMQLAFARAGVAWHEAAIASIHGRPLARTLLPLLGKRTIGLFTQDGGSPAAVASFFLAHELEDYDAWVAESLGSAQERVTALPLRELIGRRFADLNVLILKRRSAEMVPQPAASGNLAGIPDGRYAQPETGPVLLTHSDVRAVTLARFRGLPDGPIWDIGAGLGGVAIELARAFPEREVVAVERAEEQRTYLAANRKRFAAHNLRIVAGEAPDALGAEEPPAAVFLGGSGGRLDAILDLTAARIVKGGCLVANFVGLENLSRCLDHLRLEGWTAEVTQIQIAHGQPLAGLTVLAPQRPVWVVRGARS